MLLEKLWSDGKRLRPRAVVAEFEKTLRDELDLTREAANCSQLRRNFEHSPLLLVPGGALGLLRHRSDGDGADDRHPDRAGGPAARSGHRHPAARPRRRRALLHAGVPRRLLPRRHASRQHLRRHGRRRTTASTSPSISGSWARCPSATRATSRRISSPSSAATTTASRPRTSNRAGCRRTRASTSSRPRSASCWSPPSTGRCRRSRSGRVLLQLFRASRRFNVEIQPQLVLLQKTLLNVEGLGRQLDPNLDLWVTALPYLERWMNDRIGLPALKRRLLAEAPYIVAALPELPRLIHQRLTAPTAGVRRGDQGARRGAARAQRAPGRRGAAAGGDRGPAALADSVRLGVRAGVGCVALQSGAYRLTPARPRRWRCSKSGT